HGVATFSDVRIDQLGRGYTLLAETARHVSGTSTPFTIVERATHLAFVTQPPATVDGGAAITVRVAIQDTLGNTLTNASAPVTLALAPHPTGVTMATITVETVDGIATFSDVHIDQLGSGYQFEVASPGRAGATSSPFAVQATFTFVDAGTRESCGVTTHGVAYCWGSGLSGALGTGSFVFMYTAPTTPVAGGFSFATVSAGSGHTCGVTTSGAPYCWGSNGSGQLGDGTTTQSFGPVSVAGGL